MEDLQKHLKILRIHSTAILFYFVVGVAVVNISLAITLAFTADVQQHVLGASTSYLLADNGGSTGTSGGSDGGSGSSSTPTPTSETETTPTQEVSQSGETDLSGTIEQETQSLEDVLKMLHQFSVVSVGEDKNGKPETLDLSKDNLEVQIENLHNTFQIDAKDQSTGKETKLDASVLSNINAILKANGISIKQTGKNLLTLEQGGVDADTDLPMTVNVSKHLITVTTSKGSQAVDVLPSIAVKQLETNHVITALSNASNTISLIDQNGQPTFEINGVMNKKLLAVIPVTFPKTVFVSASTGQTLTIGETFLNKILEGLSF